MACSGVILSSDPRVLSGFRRGGYDALPLLALVALHRRHHIGCVTEAELREGRAGNQRQQARQSKTA